MSSYCFIKSLHMFHTVSQEWKVSSTLNSKSFEFICSRCWFLSFCMICWEASSFTERKLEPKLETKISLTAKDCNFRLLFHCGILLCSGSTSGHPSSQEWLLLCISCLVHRQMTFDPYFFRTMRCDTSIYEYFRSCCSKKTKFLHKFS